MKQWVVILVVVVTSTLSVVAGSGRVCLTQNMDENGVRTYFMAPRAAVSNSPSWTLKSEPPMPITQAMVLVRKWLKSKHPSFTFEEMSYLTLAKIWNTDFPNRWYYSMMMQGRATVDGTEVSKCFSVIMLMDGTVVEPCDKEE